MALKRNREEECLSTREDEGVEALAMNNCMKLQLGKPAAHRVFKCKICDRQFDSFQALGGHTASHSTKAGEPPKSQKTHRCSICGDEFASGQALGGHMRKHRSVNGEDVTSSDPTTSEEPTSSEITIRADVAEGKEGLKESNTRRSLDLDLNLLPPMEEENYNESENYLKFRHDDLPLETENSWKLNLLKCEDLTLKDRDLTLKDTNLDRITYQERDLEYHEFF